MMRESLRRILGYSGINDNVIVLYEEDYSPAGAGPMPGVGMSLGYCGCLCCFKVYSCLSSIFQAKKNHIKVAQAAEKCQENSAGRLAE